MKKDSLDKIHEHTFFKIFLPKVSSIVNKQDETNKKTRKIEINSILEKEDRDVLKTFDFNNQLLNTLKKIKIVRVLIRKTPGKKYLYSKDISQADYLKYHLENYYHQIFTYYEIIRLMINHVYKLGLKERQCNFINLSKKINKKDSVYSFLVTLENSVKMHNNIRNRISHYGEEIKLNKSEFIEIQETLSIISEPIEFRKNDSFENKYFRYQLLSIDQRFKDLRKEYAKDIDKSIETLILLTNRFYTIIEDKI